MRGFELEARSALAAAGGRLNISAAGHCLTRVRLTVRNRALVDGEGLRSLPWVQALLMRDDEVQLVVGMHARDLARACEALLLDGEGL